MVIGTILLTEKFETALLIACVLVGLGIYQVNRR
jgi:hypothetical protein